MSTSQHSNGSNGSSSSHNLGRVQINGYVASSSTNGTNGTNGADDNGAQRRRMDRKKSSPMMPTFMVSAPGKVIVFGEHAVVHGKVCTSISSHFPHSLADMFLVGRNRCRYLATILPSRHNPIQIQEDGDVAVSRHRLQPYMEHRRTTVGDVFAPIQEKILLLGCHVG